MCDWVTLMYSRQLTEHYKSAIMERIKIIKIKEKNLKIKKRKYMDKNHRCIEDGDQDSVRARAGQLWRQPSGTFQLEEKVPA